jgi:CheY-like chemotaxis protein
MVTRHRHKAVRRAAGGGQGIDRGESMRVTADGNSGNRGRVLVVDDEPNNSDMLARRLQRQHYRVDVVNSGKEALERLEQNAYDATLLDVMMPGLDGFQVLDRIRAGERHRDLPIIMVTAVADAEEVVRAFRAGADDYVTKPINFPVLNARLQSQVTKHQAHEHLHRLNEELSRLIATGTERLQTTYELLSSIVDSLPLVIWRTRVGADRRMELNFVQGDTVRILGLTDGGLGSDPAVSIREFVHEDDRLALQSAWQALIEGSSDRVAMEVRLHRDSPQRIHLGLCIKRSELYGIVLNLTSFASGAADSGLAPGMPERVSLLKEGFGPLIELLEYQRTLLRTAASRALTDAELEQLAVHESRIDLPGLRQQPASN